MGPADPNPFPALSGKPAAPARHSWLWALPLLLFVVFSLSVLAWTRQSQAREVEAQRLALISDALSLEAQIGSRLDSEQLNLQALARELDSSVPRPHSFAGMPAVLQGLHRFWVSITWLDEGNRIVAYLPDQQPVDSSAQQRGAVTTGLSAHLSAPLAEGGVLVARYAPDEMLRQTVPWWLARKYDVRMVDNFGSVLASTAEGGRPLGRGQQYQVSMAPRLQDTWLELTAHEAIAPWYEALPVVLLSGFIVLIAGATWQLRRQVREVMRAERAWRTEVAWRKSMEDSLTVGLRARDRDGRLLYVNRTLADMVGFTPQELIGARPPMPYWPPDSVEEITLRMRRNLAGQAPREGYEALWRRKDGRSINVMIYEAPLVDGEGRHIGWMGSILDVTERRRMEEREQRRAETMTHQARLAMLGEVGSALAHELNQPLTAIVSYNAGVLNSLSRLGFEDPVVLRALSRLGEQATHAGRVVQRIREFLTRRAPRRERCDLHAVVRHAITLLDKDLRRLDVRLELTVPEELPAVWGDPVLIEQVVINLLRNALDEMGARADAGTPPRIALSLSRGGASFVRLDVSDNGPGLGGRRIEQLCAPFYSTKAEGMGMGLAICMSIVEAHHGTFDAGPSAWGGARFSFSLPVHDPHGAHAPQESQENAHEQ
jgi:two-component system sensor histidine kinase DctS